jgi:hypothetical protein
MNHNRNAWNKQQKLLQIALSQPENHPEWITLFIQQHAQLHSSRLAGGEPWSFEDEVLNGMEDDQLRAIPSKAEHSIAWILWHLARCEDLTMNILISGAEQVFESQGWKEKLHTPFIHTGNELNVQEIKQFSEAILVGNLKEYRSAVGTATRQVVSQLTPDALRQRVNPARILIIRQSGAVLPQADGIVNYWSRRTIAGLLLMPPTRHCFTHLNEAWRIRHLLLA